MSMPHLGGIVELLALRAPFEQGDRVGVVIRSNFDSTNFSGGDALLVDALGEEPGRPAAR
jgi:hypothetical protein